MIASSLWIQFAPSLMCGTVSQPVPNLYPSGQVLPSELQADLCSLQLDSEPLPADLTAYDLITDGDMEQLSLEIEKER
jgi:hypothetical protein